MPESPFYGRPSDGRMEHAQTAIMDQNLQMHKRKEKHAQSTSSIIRQKAGDQSLAGTSMSRSRSFNYREEKIGETTPLFNTDLSKSTSFRHSRSSSNMLDLSFANTNSSRSSALRPKQSIRFQVVVWYVGQIDMVQGRVPMTFRVTIFWNDQTPPEEETDDLDSVSTRSSSVWQMHGRQRAFQKEIMKDSHAYNRAVEVPPVSILNVVTFDTIGNPEVSLLREDTKLMRWTCMYKATLVQEHWRVDGFPHDDHDITLKLAVLAHRLPGQQWDRNVWELGLATEEDSQGSTRIPHGLCVDHMSIPEFMFNKEQGLQFGLVPLNFGPGGRASSDTCLSVKLRVLRESGYYDNNIIPLLALLNLVAISTLALEPVDFFQRALLTLNIAFVEIGIRMTTDSHLPNVSYQIKMQKILNEYFCGLLFLVLEGNLVYEMHRAGSTRTIYIDGIAAILTLMHNAYTIFDYYSDRYVARRKLFGKNHAE
jgi:hypothetical protein